MRITHWKDTDTLYIALRDDAEVYESEEIAPGTVADFTKAGELVGLEFYAAASERLDLASITAEGISDLVHAAPTEKARRRARR